MESIFAKNIRYLRKQKGWKQIEMPANTGFSSSAWSNYENGLSYPRFEDLLKISKLFDVSETELIHTDIEEAHLKGENKGGKKQEKANLKANPLANLNEPNEVIYTRSTTVNQSLTLPQMLENLRILQQEHNNAAAALNSEFTAVLEAIAAQLK